MDPPGFSTFPFTNLPRELRDEIYLIFLQSSLPAPTSVIDCRHEPRREDESPYWMKNSNFYPLPPFAASTGSLNLLLVCHQIHDELLNTIERLKSVNQVKYELDCVIENEHHLLPTWLLLFPKTPPLDGTSFNISVLSISFRALGRYTGFHNDSGWHHRYGTDPMLANNIWRLVIQFLLVGPNLASSCKKGTANIELDTLAVNVLSTEWFQTSQGSNLYDEIREVLETWAYSPDKRWGSEILFWKVKRVIIALDGVVKEDWNLQAKRPLSVEQS